MFDYKYSCCCSATISLFVRFQLTLTLINFPCIKSHTLNPNQKVATNLICKEAKQKKLLIRSSGSFVSNHLCLISFVQTTQSN